MRPDPHLAEMYRANAIALGRSFPDIGSLAGHPGVATGMGTVSQRIPAIQPLIGVETTAFNHQPELTDP